MGLSLLLIRNDEKKIGRVAVAPIEIKYSFKGKSKRFPTHEYIPLKYWKDGKLSNKLPTFAETNQRLAVQLKQIEDIINGIKVGGGIPTVELVKLNYVKSQHTQIAKQPKPKAFWLAYEEFLKEYTNRANGYLKTLKTLKFRLKEFEVAAKFTLSFDYILYGTFESDFKQFCLTLPVKKSDVNGQPIIGLSNNYVNKLFGNLKIFLSYCKKRQIIEDTRAFKSEKVIRGDVLVYLTNKEVHKLHGYTKFDYPNKFDNMEIVNDSDKNGNPIPRTNKELVKDIFAFQCATGARWGDIERMTVGMFRIERGFFVWTMQKTKDIVRVPENDISVGIFVKYSKGKSINQKLFPKYSQQNFNRQLKEIGRIIGFSRPVRRELMTGSDIRKDTKRDYFTWELLSSHSGRRSFVKNLIDLGTMDTFSIMKLSGHRTIGAFQKYVSVNLDDIRKGKDLYSTEKGIEKKQIERLVDDLKKLSEEEVLKIFQRVIQK